MIKKIFHAIYRYFHKLDKSLLIAVCGVSMLSVVLLYSMVQNGVITRNFYKMQAVSLLLGAVFALILSGLDYHWFSKLWFLYGPAALGLTLLTFTSLGVQAVEGVDDKAWINLGGMSLQPSEMLKIAFILTFAFHLDKVKDKLNHIINVIFLCIHGAVPTLLVVLQGDDGTAVIFLVIFAFMIFSAGISWKYILPVLLAMPVGVWVLWDKIMLPHQKMRFLVLFADDPINDPVYSAIFYQQYWGRLALGSGELFGKGLFGDDYVPVPEVQNDFVLTYVGQCFGFLGCIALVAALTYICLKIFADSRVAKDELGKNICVGVFAMIFTHCVLNIGMVLVVLPVIGVPLPFVSQGGTSMVSMFVSVGLVMSVYSHSERNYRVFYDAE